jgi:hypothetical protein
VRQHRLRQPHKEKVDRFVVAALKCVWIYDHDSLQLLPGCAFCSKPDIRGKTEVHVNCPDELWVQAYLSSKPFGPYPRAEGSAASGTGQGLYVCFSLPLTPASA